MRGDPALEKAGRRLGTESDRKETAKRIKAALLDRKAAENYTEDERRHKERLKENEYEEV